MYKPSSHNDAQEHPYVTMLHEEAAQSRLLNTIAARLEKIEKHLAAMALSIQGRDVHISITSPHQNSGHEA